MSINEINDLTSVKLREYLKLPNSVTINRIFIHEDCSNGYDYCIKFIIIPKYQELSGKHDSLIRKLLELKGEVTPFVHAAPNFGGGLTIFFKYD
jgi:hypothetical protein